MKYDPIKRIRFLVFVLIVSAAIIVARLFMIQVVRGEEFREMAERQYVRPTPDIFSRGNIFFTEKNGNLVSAAGLKTDYHLAINPSVLRDPKMVFEKLSAVTNLDEEVFFKKAAMTEDPYEIIGKITGGDDEVEKLKEMDIRGFFLERERRRVYPSEKIASHVLGFVSRGSDGREFAGRYGVEKQYEEVLHRDGDSVYINFFAEIFSNITRTFVGGGDEFSGDVVLSIEPTVNSALSKELASLKEKWGGRSMGGIIIEPKTGRIIASSALPDFDPNLFSKEKDYSIFMNPIVESVFEMGSTIKPLTVASGIDSGVITASSTYKDEGFVILNGRRIENYDGKARGVVDMQTALGKSLNTGMINIMQKMGRETFSKYMYSFGLGEKTEIDLPGESAGLVSNLKSKYEVDYATASFGQGIALTPISVARALSALGNGGLLMKPTVVDEIKYRVGAVKKTEPTVIRRVISPQTSEEVTRMLVKVVDDELLGGTVKLKNYRVAAKTGTALLNDGKGGYDKERFLHSFFGYFPAFEPRFLIFLYTVDPEGVQYASHSLSDPFFNLARFLIGYYEIEPDR